MPTKKTHQESLNSEILKTGTDNVIGLSFWVYNNMENNDGGLYFKDATGKELETSCAAKITILT